MQQVSIQHAAAGALQAYLQTQLQTVQGLADMTVSDRWPDMKKLPSRTATVLLAGEMEKLQCDKLIALKTAIPGVTNKQTYTIQQFQCRLPLQLDLWATAHVVLDDLVARIDDLLNQGTSQLPGSFNNDPLGEGVTLLLGSKETGAGGTQQRQWQGTVMFLFDSFVGADSPDARQRQEYRATARGFADFVYTSDRIVDRLLTPTLKLKVHEIGAVGSPPANQLYDIYSINNVGKGFVWSTGS